LRGIIFDLDGTLADTLAGIAGAMNRALAMVDMPAHPEAAYRDFVGEGIEILAERVLPAAARGDVTLRAALVSAYRLDYGAHLLDGVLPYPGIVELLDTLTARELPMGVLSNKPDGPTRAMVAALFPGRFREVRGQRDDTPRKPDPAAALAIAHVLGLPPAEIALIGDTQIDLETARRAGMRPLGVAWGFRPAAELAAHGVVVLNEPSDLLAHLTLV